LSIKRTQVQSDCDADDQVQNPREDDKRFRRWVASPCDRQEQWRLVANQLGNAEDVVKWMRVGEDSNSHSRQRHEPYQVRSQLRVTDPNGPVANSRGKNQDAGCNATQHDGKGNSGRRTNFSNLADRLVHVIITGDQQGQASYAKSKYGSRRRPRQ
jgi:hypothetical protein